MILYPFEMPKTFPNTEFLELFVLIHGFSEEKIVISGFPESSFSSPLDFNES